MPANITRIVVAALVACLVTASLMTLLGLPAGVLPIVLVLAAGATFYAVRDLDCGPVPDSLAPTEWLLLGLALLIGLLRLVPYAGQYVTGGLAGAVTWDDHWHFQEVASLVNSARFPPDLNFQPGTPFHFYYLPWMPAAALSVVAEALTGRTFIKATYGLDALALNLAAVWVLLMFLRHALPAAARGWALGAVLIAGAGPDGIFAVLNLLTERTLAHVEWWQTMLGVHNQVSSLTTSLVWVPHHLIGGMAVLLAVVLATEPGSLAPRGSTKAFAAAGLLIGFAAFSSIFACLGGLIALSPLLLDLVRPEHRSKLAMLAGSALLVGAPQAYIYVNSSAAGGFVVGQAFTEWGGPSGRVAAGIAGVVVAALLMLAEVGWLYVAAAAIGPRDHTRLGQLALASVLFLLSTAVIGFSGSNNWAMRGAIVPAILIACWWAARVTAARSAVHIKIATAALALAALAHLNELALLLGANAASLGHAAETADCKQAIRRFNDSGGALDTAACRDKLSVYHIERRFQKPTLSPEDRELTGRGQIRWF